jgi:hypothetical protein
MQHFLKIVVQKCNSVNQMWFFIVFIKKIAIFLLSLLLNSTLTFIQLNHETA